MKVVLFYHSFSSCWNHGNAHFLRGVARELIRLGHDVQVYEPEDSWSRHNALSDGGARGLADASVLVPGVVVNRYSREVDLELATDGADLIIVHEWNTPEVVAEIGRLRTLGAGFTLLFHDTHHRFATAPDKIEAFDLDGYDGVLAFGDVLSERYRRVGWGRRAFTWHEAADTALFYPLPNIKKSIDLLWIGNWGDEERSRELAQYLIKPIARLGLHARVHGVRYPNDIKQMLAALGIDFAGWLPNHRAPAAYAHARATVHVPRGPYVETLPGIPTIRVFEALACGIPLICSPWRDVEGLFSEGCYLTAHSEDEMTTALDLVLQDRALADSLTAQGLRAIRERHTCEHRVRELLDIVGTLSAGAIARTLSESDDKRVGAS
jgi:spore maturation protein CgeB